MSITNTTEQKHGYILVNGIRMHYVTAGDGPLLLMLHGFPEFWYSWRHQIPALAAHFTVVAPDQRGYNETDKPDWGYDTDVLANDMVQLIDRLGFSTAHVVGHDWGGAISWYLGMNYAHRVERLAVLNCPHPKLFLRNLRRNPKQLRRSWYMGFFNLPALPEAAISANDFALIDEVFRGHALNKAAFSDEDLHAYKEALRRPGALTAALNWYRAAAAGGPESIVGPGDGKVTAPTLLIWGEQDRFLGRELTYGTEKYVPDLTIRYIPNSSHWVQHEFPDDVNQHLRDFFVQQSGVNGQASAAS
ncbi:alpha/beta hydrolase [Candidatus Gracilibacteria bacterium]|nr:alpha/beta hydrolase [Candidatus Gracilibacteria bacterium]